MYTHYIHKCIPARSICVFIPASAAMQHDQQTAKPEGNNML